MICTGVHVMRDSCTICAGPYKMESPRYRRCGECKETKVKHVSFTSDPECCIVMNAWQQPPLPASVRQPLVRAQQRPFLRPPAAAWYPPFPSKIHFSTEESFFGCGWVGILAWGGWGVRQITPLPPRG